MHSTELPPKLDGIATAAVPNLKVFDLVFDLY
jgi:hypothetical protein